MSKGIQLTFHDDGECIATPGGDPPGREHWYNRLCALMDEVNALPGKTWHKLATLPGWAQDLRTLETAFTAAYRSNNDDLPAAYMRLEKHWRDGIAATIRENHRQ